MRPAHVLHIIGGGDTGGAMSHLLPLLSGLRRAGSDVHLLCLGEGGLAENAKERGVPVVVLAMGNAWDARVLWPLEQFLKADSRGPRWDVVHTHGMRANLPVRMIVRTMRKRPCLFTTVHSDLLLDYSSSRLARVYQALDRMTVGGVDCIVCVSDALRMLLIERGYPRTRLVTIHSGLEISDEMASAAAGMGSRTSGPPRIGTIARLVAVKDLDLMLEVATVLRRSHPGLELVIVGEGPERPRLERLAYDLGLAQTVRFTGRLDDAGSVLEALDVYIVTSTFEGGVSMAVLEAMARGLPVVTTAAGGVAEAVVDGETGYVVPRGDERNVLAAALAERTAALLDDPALRARMGAAGAQRVRAWFTADRAATKTLRVYERCLVEHDRLF